MKTTRGHKVTMFNRGKTAPDMFPDVEALRGDRNGQLDALKGRDWDAVIDNSGFFPRHARLSAELLHGHVGKYMFVSSVSAYADTLTVEDDEFSATTQSTFVPELLQAPATLRSVCVTG
jgi:2'-hydroxyisoflavone reductase